MLRNGKFRNSLLLVLICAVCIAIFHEYFSTITAEYMYAVYLFILLIFIGLSFINSASLKNMKESLKKFLIWLLIFMCLIFGYAFRHELEYVKNRVVSVLIPSYSWSQGGELILSKYADGHFYVDAIGNDKTEIHFLIDTGATGVAITQKDAVKLGIDLKQLKYSHKTSTASGISYSAPVRIEKLKIGEKIFYNVRAHVSSGGLDVSLLGMSVLEDFGYFRFSGDNLILKY